MEKLWQKSGRASLHRLVESYTVGRDFELDQELIPFDVVASLAHARMLRKIGILNSSELKKLEKGLREILVLHKQGKFFIHSSQEDGHTAIEAFLTEKFGDVGKKIHTGRSRNDQVLTALRLFAKARLAEIEKSVKKLSYLFYRKARRYRGALMPGYTHMQRAMPTTVGVWLGSFADALRDDLVLIAAAASVVDQNPLGSAAGFGETVLGLDRKFTAKLMGFQRVQENPMYCAASRGKFEFIVLQALLPVMLDLGKFASDLLLFTTKEFDFFSLPDAFRTGSSIMPQKKNYDVLELMRGNVAIVKGYEGQIFDCVKNLPSGYNRDFQLTKEPFLRGVRIAADTIAVADLIVKNLKPHREKLEAACTPEIYATREAYRLVKRGMNFRDAYRRVGAKFK